jgi:hypothetical protein
MAAMKVTGMKRNEIKLVVYLSALGDRKAAYSVLVRRPEGKRPLERPRCR